MQVNNHVRVWRSKLCVVGVVGMALAWTVSAGATNVFVVTAGTHAVQAGWVYTNWATAATNIQTAIDAINTSGGNIVYVSNGLYVLTNELSLTKGLCLRSWRDGTTDRTNTIIDGGNYEGRATSNRCITIDHAQAVVDGFTFRNGVIASGYGGGVFITRGMLTNCIVISNTAIVDANSKGGGVFIASATSIVSHCDILYNSATKFGGGVSINTTAGGLVSDCLIAHNSTLSATTLAGGGGYFSYAADDMVCRNCIIRQNTAPANGAGVQLWRTSGDGGLVENCEIIDNNQTYASAGRDGAGVCIYGNGTVRNCLIAGNTNASTYKSAIQIYGYTDTTGVVDNCTVVSNTRGVAFYTTTAGLGLIRNSIIYDNIYTNHDNSANVFFTNSCTVPLPDYGSGNTAADPLFVEPGVTNYQLTSTSPCIDAGDNQPWMDTARELGGRRRIDGFRRVVDMGAYEFLRSGSVFSVR